MYGIPTRTAAPLTDDQIRRVAPSVFATEAHHSRSDRYAFIPTSEVLAHLRSNGFLPYQARQSVTRLDDRRAFTKHELRLRQAGQQLLQVGDVVPEVILTNSHDGSSGYQVSAGFFRLVCSNGLVVGDSTVSRISVRHSGNVAGEVLEGVYRVVQDIEPALERINTYRSVQLDERRQHAFAEAALALRYDEGKAPIQAGQLLTSRRYEDRGDDLWRTFNRVQENLVRGGLRGRTANGKRTSTRAINGLDQDARLNRSLWILADALAGAAA